MGHGYFVYRLFLPFLYALEVTSGYISLEKYGLKKVFFYLYIEYLFSVYNIPLLG